eukprot:SAG25_NODE_665_length_6064_cov_2064.163621_2_plen_50_part_00
MRSYAVYECCSLCDTWSPRSSLLANGTSTARAALVHIHEDAAVARDRHS